MRAALLTATLALIPVAAALAQPAAPSTASATYPASRSLPDISSWLMTDTPLVASQVVDIGPSAVTAITASTPTGVPRGFSAQISAETLDPSIGAQDLVLSWSIPVDVDCDNRSVRLGPMTGYPARDLHTAPRVVRDPDPNWVVPSPASPLGYAVLRALCDRDFKRPLVGGRFPTSTAKSAKAVAKPPEPAAPPAEPTPAAAPPAPKTPKATPAASAPRGPAPAAGGLAVQVGASPSQADAKGLMGKVQKKFAGDLGGFSTDVVSAEVEGKTVYRAVITGFHAASEATALCEKLKTGGQACFVRR